MALQPEFKIILLGDPGVGKTTYFCRIKEGEFVDTDKRPTASLGVENLEHTLTIDGVEVKAYLHDTGGGERFRTLTSNFYRNADAAILMYSVEDRFTFENLQEWIENCQDSVEPDNFVWALIGNKSDLPLEVRPEGPKARCDQLATDLNFYTSAKAGDNVVSSFEEIVQELYRKKVGRNDMQPRLRKNERTIKVKQTSAQKKRSC